MGQNIFVQSRELCNEQWQLNRLFYLERGTRQGDPISACLFILALEILFIQMKDNRQIKGVMIDGHEIKLSAYAYDGNILTTKCSITEFDFNQHL